jgi:hypothetical protein
MVAKSSDDQGNGIFLGLTNFYMKFIKDFFALAKPFTDIFNKEWSFEWNDEQQNAFNLLKGKLSSTLM